jgi:mono/diheme cytochrome c family protein
MKSLIATAFFITVLTAVPAMAQTQASDIGKLEYTENCAVCHGTTGEGNGLISGLMAFGPVADLTTISKRNNGVFPFARIYGIIDGTEEIKWHGTRQMPIWGTQYTAKGFRSTFEATPSDIESYVQGRIVALVGYIYSLQKK